MSGVLLTTLAVLVGVCLHTAVHHLWVGLRRPTQPVHVIFGLMSFIITAYVLVKLGAYRAVSAEELVAIRRWETNLGFIATCVLPWFAAEYTGVRRRTLLLAFGVASIVVIMANFALPYGISFVEMPSLQHLTLPWGEQVVDLRVHQRSAAHNAAWVMLLLNFVYSVYASVLQYRQGERRRAMELGLALGVFLAFTAFNYIVNVGLVEFTHTAEFGYIALVLLMSAALSRELRENEAAIALHHIQLEERVRERTAELAGDVQELQAFSYSVSHDLRAPLHSIDGYSQLLVADHSVALDATAKHYLDRIHQGAQHMNELIEAMLELSRVTQTSLQLGITDLSALANKSFDQLRADEPSRAATVSVAPGLTARADPRLIAIVLDNLIGNAWKYTARTEHTRIEFGAEVQSDGTTYYVKDNGAGFDMQYAGKLFTPFQRLHTTEDFAGTGVGLATVARIVRRHGGRIWPKSEIGKGTTFFFTL